MHSTPRSEFFAGARAMTPLVLGAIPFGMIYGALALDAGLSALEAMLMSIFVFAGSSQFIGVTLIAQGASSVLIIVTTFIVNARHALYSASLAPYLSHLPQRWLLPLAYFLTDESFAVTIARFESEYGKSPHRHWFMLGADLAMFVNWQLCTVLGIVAGSLLQDADLGLDFAMSVTFIGLVVPLIRSRPMLVCAVVAGATALALNGLPNKLGLMLAAVAAIAAGYIAESAQTPERSAKPSGSSEARA